MTKNLQIFFVGLASLIIGLSTGLFLQGKGTDKVVQSPYTPRQQQTPNSPSSFGLNPPNFSYDQLYQIAQSITVKVLSGQTSGSGILIQKQGEIYTVVTNNHVLVFGLTNQSYRIKTEDNQIHNAQVIKSVDFKKNDLGLLQFRSQNNYKVATISSLAKINYEAEVYAAGFPAEIDSSSSEFVLSTGKIKMFSDLAFGGGYQIGSTNKVQKGMSGGPLLNRQGEIIGINGVHRYPLWGNPYVFEDGSVASPEKKQLMSQYSWAIPIQTFLNIAPEFARK
ncbi:S1 family peptidase [Gloeothece verrucosa]|uniref:Peptidase S1 and S6 chymotrypsin/Hap n=1 Tax=Gloeothece verrucosa (strain PCC 7822) TaxID=497965 RepID=E0U9M3_GLOV7|nr:serine protease [Gloeothece verrucosa]ADN13824.1 peptidase S1 and S6 chymotrypsin/Hap [Gloeothece verrucosa PCC 7822]